jgi:hypothetical protein
MAAGPRHIGKRGWLLMENSEEGCASPTAATVDSKFATHGGNNMHTAHGGNHMPKIPDAADEIEVRHVAMRNLEEMQRGAWLNHMQIAHTARKILGEPNLLMEANTNSKVS